LRSAKVLGRIRGALLGCLLGDGFGRPLEGVSFSDGRLCRWVDQRRNGSDPLGYSDDAEMMMMVGESLMACGAVHGPHLLAWMAEHHDPARGYGKGMGAALAGTQLWPEGSEGNGAAARVTAIACRYPRDPTPRFLQCARRFSLAAATK
jgi:ADP-ribosylglycohydrolase